MAYFPPRAQGGAAAGSLRTTAKLLEWLEEQLQKVASKSVPFVCVDLNDDLGFRADGSSPHEESSALGEARGLEHEAGSSFRALLGRHVLYAYNTDGAR